MKLGCCRLKVGTSLVTGENPGVIDCWGGSTLGALAPVRLKDMGMGGMNGCGFIGALGAVFVTCKTPCPGGGGADCTVGPGPRRGGGPR
eukprot:767051-Hanusia_phi.AAC.10